MASPFERVITRSYVDVDTSNGIHTEQFLEATHGLINMFDLFGSSAFSVVQNDMRNNVKKIRTWFVNDTKANDTLEKLMANESHLKKRQATEAVVWLKSLDNPKDELSVSFIKAYDATLRPFHSFILAMNACPWRKDFYANIGIEDEKSIQLMREWLDGLFKIIDKLNREFEQYPAYLRH
ncbi:glycolipid transfer protein domain-containing protein [Thamnidium elegans]|nr:glycolipid transfer protein domain-containing protein [Thamnidium elegans]